jgi:hypothetical protein
MAYRTRTALVEASTAKRFGVLSAVKVLSVLSAIKVLRVLSAFAQVGSGDTVRRRPAVRAQRAARRLRPAVTEWEQPQLLAEWPSQPFV